jgi:type 1 glutamine amidotransferase
MSQKTALIFWGGWEGHTPERSAAIVREVLEAHGVVMPVVWKKIYGTARVF